MRVPHRLGQPHESYQGEQDMTIEEATEVCRKSLLPVRVAFCFENEPARYGYIAELGTPFNFDHGNRIIYVKFDNDLKASGWSAAKSYPVAERWLTFV